MLFLFIYSSIVSLNPPYFLFDCNFEFAHLVAFFIIFYYFIFYFFDFGNERLYFYNLVLWVLTISRVTRTTTAEASKITTFTTF